MIEFGQPLWLLLLPVVAAGWCWSRRRPARLPVSSSADLALASPVVRLEPFVDGLKLLALVLLVLALAGPREGMGQRTLKGRGVDILLAVDVSESMAALDFEHGGETLNRLEAVKTVVRDFVQRRAGDSIGLVAFGSQAYTQLPLTMDHQALITALDALEIGSAGKSTAVGDALGISLKRLPQPKTGEQRSQIVILLTDGRSNSGELTPEAAARIAAQRGVKVYTIGVGGSGPAPFIIDHPIFGRRVVQRRVDLDVDTLQTIAKETGGRFFRAQDRDELVQVYDAIGQLEPHEIETTVYTEYRELYPWCLGPALALLALWALLVNTRFLRLP